MFKQEAINTIRTGETRKRNSNITLTESERTTFTILPDLLEGHEFFIDFDAMEKELSKVKPYELQKIIKEVTS